MTVRRPALLLAAVVFSGCASLADTVPTRPPGDRAAADVARDRAECDAYAKAQPKHREDHFQACLLARGHAANVDMDNLNWVIGVAQTRAHEPGTILQDMAFCDTKADNARNSDVVVLTPEQEQSIAGQAFSQVSQSGPTLPYQQRPNASRTLLACLADRGYAIVPWVPMNER